MAKIAGPCVGMPVTPTRTENVTLESEYEQWIPEMVDEIVNLARREMPDLEVLAFGADEVGAAMPLPEGTEYHRRPAQDQLALGVWKPGLGEDGVELILEAAVEPIDQLPGNGLYAGKLGAGRVYEFDRAAELIEIGRQQAEKAVKQFKQKPPADAAEP